MAAKRSKRPRGRPTLDEAEQRKHRKVRMTDAEWAWLSEQAAAADITASEFIRRRALRGMPKPKR